MEKIENRHYTFGELALYFLNNGIELPENEVQSNG